MSENVERENDETNLYEVGFHIIPTVSEEAVSSEAAKITNIISKHQGVVKASEGPALRGLSYVMVKHMGGKNYRYDSAYFGSISFEASAQVISQIKAEIDKLPNILRSILIVSAPEALVPRERKVSGKIEPEKYRPEKPATPKAPISDAELDKTIAELIVE